MPDSNLATKVRPIRRVAAMRGLLLAATAILALPCHGENSGGELPAGSLCKSGEKVYFDCRIGSGKSEKHLSLCGSNKLSDAGAFLQYRFGRAETLELAFPEPAADPAKHFYFAHYARYQVSRTAVRFSRQNAEYRIFDSYEADSGPAQRTQGVEVAFAGKTVTLKCIGPTASALGELQDSLPCDQDDALNMGECP